MVAHVSRCTFQSMRTSIFPVMAGSATTGLSRAETFACAENCAEYACRMNSAVPEAADVEKTHSKVWIGYVVGVRHDSRSTAAASGGLLLSDGRQNTCKLKLSVVTTID